MRRQAIRSVILVLLLGVLALAGGDQSQPVQLRQDVHVPFHFIAYGDTRFTDPNNTVASNAAVRQVIVKAIADAHPAFVVIGGDIVYNGYDVNDWLNWDKETAAWREQGIPIYPAIGNHDMHGEEKIALANYFQRFPALNDSEYYSVRAANVLLLVLDSSIDENSGPQHDWLSKQLDQIPAGVDFVLFVLHHPPITSSHDHSPLGGGHDARPSEQALGAFLEARQQTARARFIVIASHVHNYERHEHGGITYFVTGGGGAHAYPIDRAPGDPYPDNRINYHYLDVVVDSASIKFTMNRVELQDGKPVWTQPDSVTIQAAPAPPTPPPAPQK
jgi:Icc-related predicted phosphoesterase